MLADAAGLVQREGGNLSHFFMSWAQYTKLVKQTSGRVVWTNTKLVSEDGLSLPALKFNSHAGEITIVPDRTCPNNRIYGLDLSTWKLHTMGKMIQLQDDDGLQFIRVQSSTVVDSFKSFYHFYGQLVCRAPGWNVNITMPVA